MAKPRKPLIEAAGWGFYGVTFLLLLGPALYLSYNLKYDDTSAMVWIGLGLMGAATLGVVITTIANTIIQARLGRIRAAEERAEQAAKAETKASKKKKNG